MQLVAALHLAIVVHFACGQHSDHVQHDPPRFRVIREWTHLNFTWPNETVYEDNVKNGNYVPENNVAAGITSYGDYYYIALPRMFKGTPATLTRIRQEDNSTAPLLMPYPSWEMNKEDTCDSIQNTQNLEVDTMGRLWIIDGGKKYTMTGEPVIECLPKILIYDLNKNETIAKYEFPQNVVHKSASFLYDLVVDDYDGYYAYITDNSRVDPGIIVFSLKNMTSWKIRNFVTMKAQENATTFNVDGVQIDKPISIAGIALGLKNAVGDRQVYYSPISSLRLYSINASVLRDPQNGVGEYTGFVRNWGARLAQSDGMVADQKGVLYFGLLPQNSLIEWDTHTPFDEGQKVIAKDPKLIQWPNAFTITAAEDLVVLTNRLEKFIFHTMNLSEHNFRLVSRHIGSRSYLFDKGPNETAATTTEGENHVHFRLVTTTTTVATVATTELGKSTTTMPHSMNSSSTLIPNSLGQNSTSNGNVDLSSLLLICSAMYLQQIYM